MFSTMNFTDGISTRILTAMAGDPQREYYQREVASLAGISVGSANGKLKCLAAAGVVSARKAGKMIFYRYNLDSPVARQVKVLLTVNALGQLIRDLEQHARKVILYGSCAEGTDARDSDIDLFVLSEASMGVRAIVRKHARGIPKKVSALVVSPSEFRRMRSKDRPLYRRIVNGTVLWDAR